MLALLVSLRRSVDDADKDDGCSGRARDSARGWECGAEYAVPSSGTRTRLTQLTLPLVQC